MWKGGRRAGEWVGRLVSGWEGTLSGAATARPRGVEPGGGGHVVPSE